MSKLPYVLGGGALAAYLWARARHASEREPAQHAEHLSGDWVWPVPTWNARTPVISDGFNSHRDGKDRHGGVDLMFTRKPSDPFAVGSPNGSRMFVMPDRVPALATSDGIVWSALKTPRGFAVVIDHGKPFATFYTHLEQLLVQPTARAESKQLVRAGQPIGIIGFDPLDPAHLRHLHFEMWENGGPSAKIDPEAAMRGWRVLDPPRETLAARNASLHYRRVGARGEAYPQWVRGLKDASGVYIIRDRNSREIVYVGSSVRRLYDTLTRHFSTWRRWKAFWKDQYAQTHDPGVTYERDAVEVAVRITRADEALDEEARLIERLRPRDNILGQPAEEVPF